jgi:hypothetical protein
MSSEQDKLAATPCLCNALRQAMRAVSLPKGTWSSLLDLLPELTRLADIM